MGVNPTGGSNRRQIAENLFNKLDAKDGNTNQQIDASVWNAFVSANGTGKTIKNFITKQNAMNSIMTYLSRKTDLNTTLEQLGEEWAKMDRVDTKTDDNGVFKKDENPPAPAPEAAKPELGKPEDRPKDINKDALVNMYTPLAPAGKDISKMTTNEIINTKFEQYKDQEKVELPAGSGKFFTFDSEGYIEYITNKNGDELLNTAYDEDTKQLYISEETQYNEDGIETRYVSYNKDGSIENEYNYTGKDPNQYTVDYYEDHTEEFVYPSTETDEMRYTKKITRDLEGNVTKIEEYEYDAKNNLTKKIYRDAEGNVTSYEEYEYDENNNTVRTITRDKDGNVTEVYDNKREKYIIINGKRV